ncbi:serine/threonine-protein kinase pakH-like, partial [Empidonax traillii]|uniref:serine/threonine-protein kinase pakH-like n=1 Tax=Empidonax traillii TaxID=164674 RepID=UPI000FFD83A4
MAVLCVLCPKAKKKPPQLQTPRDVSPVFRSFLKSCLTQKGKRRWTASQLLKHHFLEKSKSLAELAPLVDAARRPTTPAPEPLLAPSVSGQECKEEQGKKEVQAKPEGKKSILQSSAREGAAVAPQLEEVSFPNAEMPSTSTGKGDTGKKSIAKKVTDQPPPMSPLTRLYLADL